uniref:Uncharacterized protein n=1 Tax=Rhizophora mucronata TaxID=61149 RepID=A0A2P2IH89_RHIMU
MVTPAHRSTKVEEDLQVWWSVVQIECIKKEHLSVRSSTL